MLTTRPHRSTHILITGGTGFLGAALAERARRAGFAVTTLDRDGAADRVCNVGDPAAVTSAIRETAPDVVVHLAAALTDAAAADAVMATQVNALGSAAVFSASVAARVPRVVYASSVAAVGPCPLGSGDDVALQPGSIYGATKAFGEHLARAMSGPTTRFLALRFGWVYGPGRVRGWRVAQDMVEGFAAGLAHVRYPDDPAPMDWTYIDDAAEVLVRALDCPLAEFTALNVVGDLRPIRDAVAHLASRFPDVQPDPQRVDMPPSGWGMRNDRLQQTIGFEPRIRLEEGLDRMLTAFAVAAKPANSR